MCLDEMNGVMAVDLDLLKEWENIKPHRNAYDLTEDPFKLSRNLSIPGPLISTISNWLSDT